VKEVIKARQENTRKEMRIERERQEGRGRGNAR
jgi:hypothetical protein